MLTITGGLPDLTFALAAGEPFLLQIQFTDPDGVVIDTGTRAFQFSAYEKSRVIVNAIGGERDTDETGPFLQIARDGLFSDSLAGKTLGVDFVERYRNGVDLIARGRLTVGTSAAGVPSYDAAPIGTYAIRLTIREGREGQPATLTQQRVPYVGNPETITLDGILAGLITVFAGDTRTVDGVPLNASLSAFDARLDAHALRLTAIGV